MVSTADFISLDYTPDMTQAGIQYACQSLPYTYDRIGGTGIERLRRIVTGKAVELAFVRCLNKHHIPHDTLGTTTFSAPDKYDVAIGGHRCDIKCANLVRKSRIRLARRNPDSLLEAQALVPVDQIMPSRHLHYQDNDLLIFAFLLALTTPTQKALHHAMQANLPVFFISPLPDSWARPGHWKSLGEIAAKSNASLPFKLEIGGQDHQRSYISEQIKLNPLQRTVAQQDFYTVSYLHTLSLPDGMAGIHSAALKDTYLVEPQNWGNIWIYGMELILCGYLSRGEFRDRAHRLPAGSQTYQYKFTQTENLSLPIKQLSPLQDLFDHAKAWKPRRSVQ